MKDTIKRRGITYSFVESKAGFRWYCGENDERILVDEFGKITHEDNPKGDNIVAKYRDITLSDIIAWRDEKEWSQGQ